MASSGYVPLGDDDGLPPSAPADTQSYAPSNNKNASEEKESLISPGVNSDNEEDEPHQPPKRPLQETHTKNPDTEYHPGRADRDLSRQFSHRTQLTRLLLTGLVRWLITAALIGAMYRVIYYYWSLTLMSDKQKKAFNTLATAISMLLGLNIASSLEVMATDIRWWILSQRKRHVREVDAILNCGSLSALAGHAMSYPRPGVILAFLGWLSLNIVAQLGIATLGLTWELKDATDSAIHVPGNINIPTMENFYSTGPEGTDFRTNQHFANSYGNAAVYYRTGNVSDIPDPNNLTFYSDVGVQYWNASDHFRYVFMDTPADIYQGQMFYSNRSINVTWSCTSLQAVGDYDHGYKPLHGDNVTLDFPEYLRLGISYVTRDNETCGSRCARVTALELLDVAWYYDCNITAGHVVNATRDKPDTSNDFAWTAAAAIALKGYYPPGRRHIEYQIYPMPHPYATAQNGNADGMGRQIASFAIGVIAGAATNNPPRRVLDHVYAQGVRLSVPFILSVHVILGLTGGLLLLLCIIVACVADRVVVIEESALAISHLLAPLVNRLGAKGFLLSGKEISRELHTDVVYTCSEVDSSTSQLYQLEVGESHPDKRFPDGWYR